MTAKFEVGKTYGTTAVGDHNMIYKVTVLKRSPQSVVVEGEVNKRCKIHVTDSGVEFIRTGNYSFAPVFMANSEVE